RGLRPDAAAGGSATHRAGTLNCDGSNDGCPWTCSRRGCCPRPATTEPLPPRSPGAAAPERGRPTHHVLGAQMRFRFTRRRAAALAGAAVTASALLAITG